jgi:hypothetical protein
MHFCQRHCTLDSVELIGVVTADNFPQYCNVRSAYAPFALLKNH